MIKNKKIYLTILSLATLSMPIISTVACNDNNASGNRINSLFDQTLKAIKERTDLLTNTNLSTLAFDNDIFVSDVSKPLNASDLGLNFDGNAKLLPESINLQEKYYIFDIDASSRNVKLQVSLSTGEDTSLNSTASFLTITSFEQTFDLNHLSPLSPIGSDESLANIVLQANSVPGSEITIALENLVERYVNAQAPGLERDFDYTISNIEAIDGSAIYLDNLQENARTYKAWINARSSSTKISNQTTLKISLPKLNLYDLSQFPVNFVSLQDDWKVDDPRSVTSSYAIKIIKSQIIAAIKENNRDVTWDDLYATFSVTGTSRMPAMIDLTNQDLSIDVDVSSLPYSKNTFNKQTITVILPSITG